jgi:hypothetical protein
MTPRQKRLVQSGVKVGVIDAVLPAGGSSGRLRAVAAVVVTLTALAGCAAPINTRSADAETSGRCKLLAYKEDRGRVAFGLIPMIVTQSNVDARRQDIYDSCIAAGGTREKPTETQ